ncbi:MAG: hypothetical protein LBK99_13115 [Opitutaceae bacterium]|jgi:hypothetical protein|nr:hypothetical protein [Opitutaceae bacterium]
MRHLVILLLCLNVAGCVSKPPRPDPTTCSFLPGTAPIISYSEALQIASDFAKVDNPDIDRHYIDRVWLGWIPGDDKECWIVSWADPTSGWYFVAVYMDRIAKRPPGGGIYSQNPFMQWSFIPSQ